MWASSLEQGGWRGVGVLFPLPERGKLLLPSSIHRQAGLFRSPSEVHRDLIDLRAWLGWVMSVLKHWHSLCSFFLCLGESAQPSTRKKEFHTISVRESDSRSVVSDSLRPTDYTVHGILQARTLGWVAVPFRGSSHF